MALTPSRHKADCHAAYEQSIYFSYVKSTLQQGTIYWLFGSKNFEGFFIQPVARGPVADVQRETQHMCASMKLAMR
jgi:hypothetical protein